jgi:Uma2 family endonuclease
MNVHLPTHMSKAAFIDWMDGREGRYELVRGRVVMMPRPARRHALIVGNLYLHLRNQLDPERWQAIIEFGLDAEQDTMRYPDIVVDAIGGKGKDYTAISPVLLAEVLSPSTAEIDLGDKAAEYLQLPSLKAYLVFSQDEPKAWVWLRGEQGFGAGPQIVAGADQAIAVKELALDLPLSAIYAGLPSN